MSLPNYKTLFLNNGYLFWQEINVARLQWSFDIRPTDIQICRVTRKHCTTDRVRGLAADRYTDYLYGPLPRTPPKYSKNNT